MRNRSVAFNDILVVVLAAVTVVILVLEFTVEFSPAGWVVIQGVDIAIALTFLGEFCYRYIKAPHKGMFLIHHWWQLLAAIPVTTLPTQTLRALMLLRVAHIIRFTSIGARLMVPLAPFLSFVYKTRTTAILSVFFFVFLTGTILFHIFEVDTNPDIAGFWDTVMYAVGAVTTTDLFTTPQTLGGELATILLMFAGVTTLGVFTAYVASYLVQHPVRE